jgi:hypothetical protein
MSARTSKILSLVPFFKSNVTPVSAIFLALIPQSFKIEIIFSCVLNSLLEGSGKE